MAKMTGRKFRNLSNGRWYTSKRQAASATLRSEKAKARVDPELIMKCSLANQNEESIKKRSVLLKEYYAKRPEHRPAMIKNCFRLYPWMRERVRDMSVFLTNSRNGVLVLKKVMCEREKSVGVNRYDL